MPGRDGTGPVGIGLNTVRRFDFCKSINSVRYGAGIGMGLGHRFTCRRGPGKSFGRSNAISNTSAKTEKELLQDNKAILQDQIEVINKQLESL